MTDRVHALTVTLDGDYRDDDVEAIVAAIRMVKGVAAVTTHVTDLDDYLARSRVRHEVLGDLYEAVKNALDPQPKGGT